jgi:hypothetical protein
VAARTAVDAPSHLRSHRLALMLPMLVALVHERQRKITDTLADLLISTVHRIGARAERRVTPGVGCQKSAVAVTCGDASKTAVGEDDRRCPFACST